MSEQNDRAKHDVSGILEMLKQVGQDVGLSNVIVNVWQNQSKEGEPMNLFQVKGRALLRPVDVQEILSAVKLVKIKGKKKSSKIKSGLIAVPCPMDAHFGKLALSGKYNAKKVYLDVIQQMANTLQNYNIDKIIFPLGSDLIHFDNAAKQTTRGTYIEVEGTRFDVAKDVISAAVTSINLLSTIAPVEVVVLRGNHDDHSMTLLGTAISAMFEMHDGVTVNDTPGYRKYTAWGECLIGFTHGDKGNLSRIASAMPVDVPELWGKSKYRELLCGHLHHRQSHITVAKEEIGIYVKFLPSLSPADRWHDDNAFVGAFQGAEMRVYDKSSLIATYSYKS
jgi:hypothetical protein